MCTWEKLKRVVAWLILASHILVQLQTRQRAQNNSSKKLEQKNVCLSLSDLDEAERRIVRSIQNQAFPEEFHNPESNKGLLAKLKPFVN